MFVAEQSCEQGWRYYGGNCYLRQNGKKASWQDAQTFCASKQANLVTVNDNDEQKFLDSILGRKGSWCGLNNQKNRNVFEWVSGEQSDYANWAIKQPRKNTKKRCVHIQFGGELGHKWEMSKCAAKFRYTCEKGMSWL